MFKRQGMSDRSIVRILDLPPARSATNRAATHAIRPTSPTGQAMPRNARTADVAARAEPEADVMFDNFRELDRFFTWRPVEQVLNSAGYYRRHPPLLVIAQALR
jgi:hypothetical protein